MKAAIYVRLSNQDRARGDNLEAQEITCRTELDRAGYDYYKTYFDDGVSGALEIDNRPGLLKALNAAKRGSYEVLVIRSVKRFARAEPSIAYDIFREFEKIGIQIHTTEDGLLNKDTFWNQHIKIGLAYQEREDITRRTKEGRYRSAEQGHIVSGQHVSYGFEKIRHGTTPKNSYSTLEVLEVEKVVVEQIYKDFLDGMNYTKIAEKLNEQGIPKHEDNSWTKEFIGRMIRNPIYKGDFYYGRTKVTKDKKRIKVPYSECKHVRVEQIIDDVTWDQAQLKAASIARRYQRRNPTQDYLLRGRIFCIECQTLYACRTEPRGDKFYCYYVHDRSVDCTNTGLNLVRDTIDGRIIDELEILMNTDVTEIIELHDEQVKDQQAELDRVRKERQKLSKKLNTARDKLAGGIMDNEDFVFIKEQVNTDDKILANKEQELIEITQPEVMSALDSMIAELEEHELEQEMKNPTFTMYEDFDNQFEYMDRANVRVEVVKRADTKLKGKLKLISSLGNVSFSNGPTRRSSC